uniref:Peptidase S74 domain-containing protein n=1 Tax=Parastrongyloides trichosuri TaxID=131310 RepID=A0A0N4ZFS5_PARTI
MYLDFDSYITNSTIKGITLKNPSSEYKASFNTRIGTTVISKSWADAEIHFTINKCDFGMLYFDKIYGSDQLDKKVKYDYGVLIVAQSASNRIMLNEYSVTGTSVNIGPCPYTNWVNEKSILKFHPNTHLIDIGFFVEDNERTHIITPIYRMDNDSDFFSCGKLIQHAVPPLPIGYKIIEIPTVEKNIESDITPLDKKLVCNESEIYELYHFGYTKGTYSHNGKSTMQKIDPYQKNLNYYSGQTILLYDRKKINDNMKAVNSFQTISDKGFTVEPKCIKKLKSDMKVLLIPRIKKMELTNCNNGLKTCFLMVNELDFDKAHDIECVSIIDDYDESIHFDNFYSKLAEISVIKVNSTNGMNNLTSVKVGWKNFFSNFGAYTCSISKKAETYNDSLVNFGNTFILPEDEAILALDEVNVEEVAHTGANCIKSYDTWANLSKISASVLSKEEKFINVDDILNFNGLLFAGENKIYLGESYNDTVVLVTCTYKTIAEKKFITTQDFIYPKYEYSNDEDEPSSNMKKSVILIGIGSTLFISVIMVFVTIFIMRNKNKRKKIIEKSLLPDPNKI